MFAPLASKKETKPVSLSKSPITPQRNPALQRQQKSVPSLRIGRARSTQLQPKLQIGAVSDPLEAEANRIAKQVLHSPAAAMDNASGQDGAASSPHTASHTSAPLPTAGRPLDSSTRTFFEPRFGHDFGRVRIHSDEKAAASAQSIGALAYTAGPNIAFAGDRYQPSTSEGRRLIAHELTHVVQQGHASAIPNSNGLAIASNRATPAIQRDTPATGQAPTTTQNQQPGLAFRDQLSITASADTVTRQDVTQALTDYLYKVQEQQKGQTLHVDDTVRWAVRRLFATDPMGSASAEAFLAGSVHPGSAPEFAAAVTRLLPDVMPRSRAAFLGTQSAKETPDTRTKSIGDAAGHLIVDSTVAPIVKKLGLPKSWQDKIIEGARGAVADGMVGLVDQAMSGSSLGASDKAAIHSAVEAAIKQKSGAPFDRQQDGAGSPYAPWQPPSLTQPGSPYSAPGEHIFNLPKIPWDVPTQPLPKPNLPQAPAASDAAAIDSIIQGLDDNSLVPAAAKGTATAGDYASAKEFARNAANLIAAADKKKQGSVELTIGINYRHVDDLRDIFDRMQAIVRQIATGLPGGAANVSEVIITPARTGKDDSLPARRVVRLHSSE